MWDVRLLSWCNWGPGVVRDVSLVGYRRDGTTYLPRNVVIHLNLRRVTAQKSEGRSIAFRLAGTAN